MRNAHTIAMAETLLAEGRSTDAVRMLEPLALRPVNEDTAEDSDICVRALLARSRLLRYGRTDEVFRLLKPYVRFSARESLDARTRASVALWLGWAYAWHDPDTQQHARALSLLHEAERVFISNRNAAGRCWVLLGQAQAYFSVDEYRLMRHVLDQASPLLSHIHDIQAQAWYHDLQAVYARYRSRTAEARDHIDSLQRIAVQLDDRMLLARGFAQEAALGVDTGELPEKIAELARKSRKLLHEDGLRSLYALLTGYRAEIQAHIRTGATDEAEKVLGHAEAAIGKLTAVDAFIGPQRAQLVMVRGEAGAAEVMLEDLLDRTRGSYYRILMTSALLLDAELKLTLGKSQAALAALDEVDRSVVDTAYRRHSLESALIRIQCNLAEGNLDEAREILLQVRHAPELSSLMPLAARRYAVEAAVSEAHGDAEEALASYLEALAAYRLVRDASAVRETEVSIAGLRERFTLEAVPIAALLARSAIKQELVADAWLQFIRELLPNGSASVFRSEAGKPATVFASFGEPAPGGYTGNGSRSATAYQRDVRFALCEQCDSTIEMRITSPEETELSSALPEMRKWLPVVRLAFEYAELRGDTSEACHCHDHGEVSTHSEEEFLAHSPAMESVLAEARRVRSGSNPVLITGDRGTGKSRLARAIHAMSDRKHGHLEMIDCCALKVDSAREVLFGTDGEPGALQRATGGTVVLDHVDRLPADVQRHIAQYLKNASETGGRQTARIIALTHSPADVLVRSDRMREDFYYAINMISLHLPPLRDRREDIPLLSRHLVRSLTPAGMPEPVITAAAMEALASFDWPGNVGELEAELQRIVSSTGGEPTAAIMPEDLSDHIRNFRIPRSVEVQDNAHVELEYVLAGTERAVIEKTLREHGGKVASSAEALGLTRQGLYKKMKRLGIGNQSKYRGETGNGPRAQSRTAHEL